MVGAAAAAVGAAAGAVVGFGAAGACVGAAAGGAVGAGAGAAGAHAASSVAPITPNVALSARRRLHSCVLVLLGSRFTSSLP